MCCQLSLSVTFSDFHAYAYKHYAKTHSTSLYCIALPLGVWSMAWARFVTLEAVDALWADAGFTHLAHVTWLAQTSTANVVTCGSIFTATGLAAVHAILANRTFILAPAKTHAQDTHL